MSSTRSPAYDQPVGSVEASRRGAHRARVKPALATAPILAGVLIVLGAVGGAWYVLGDSSAKDSSPSVEAAVQDDPTGTAPASAGSSAGAIPAESAQPQDSSAGTDSGNTANVDHGISIRVLNSIAVQGLAARVSDDLKRDGWTVSGTGNSKQKGLSTTKVYYGGKDTKATARALVKDLGFGSIVLDSSVAKSGLVVVLGHDAQ